MDALTTAEIALRLGCALGLGGLMGLERERKNRPAGFRTMILISLGSAGFMLAGQEAIRQGLPASGPGLTGADISRVLQGLIGGIGFLGAGAVIQNKKAVRGLTTAAAVWVTACIGAACGIGLYVLASILATFALFTLVILEIVEDRYFPDQAEEDRKQQEQGEVIRIVLDQNGKPVQREVLREAAREHAAARSASEQRSMESSRS
jgi:putative Mg2+ transporter-C (MgtC) family protein